VVEGGGLENRFTSIRDGGSNPSPSAIRSERIIDFVRLTQAEKMLK
jgi:hypothetical protein